MTDLDNGTLAVILVFVVIILFVFSAWQKRKHEAKMAEIRAQRKAIIEKAKEKSSDGS